MKPMRSLIVVLSCLTLAPAAAAARVEGDVQALEGATSAQVSGRPSGAARLRLAQGGSTGGTLGKQDQSLSGDQPSKEPPAPKGAGQHSSSITGRWQWTQNCQFGSYRGNLEISHGGGNRFGGSVYQASPEASGPIVEGRLQGDRISFKVTLSGIVETFHGSLSGSGRLQGTSTTQNYAPCTWSASRG